MDKLDVEFLMSDIKRDLYVYKIKDSSKIVFGRTGDPEIDIPAWEGKFGKYDLKGLIQILQLCEDRLNKK